MHKVSVEQRAHDLALLQIQLESNNAINNNSEIDLINDYMKNYIKIHKELLKVIEELERN